jgi:hypothetical protein
MNMRVETKFNFIYLNIGCLILYFFSLILFKQTGIALPINLIGFPIVLFLIPYNIIRPFKEKFSSEIELFLAELVIYFTLIVPIYYFINKIGFKISDFNVFFLWITTFLIGVLFSKNKIGNSLELKQILLWLKENYILIIAIALFFILHLVNYHFYKFIPEGDGYIDMVKIDKTVETGYVGVDYRQFFNTSMALLESFSKINVYSLFSFWMIGTETTLIIVIYLLVKKHEIKSRLTQFMILLTALSIPVINMETDYIRPQTIILILLPTYIYFLFIALRENKKLFYVLSTLIALICFNYHQFFAFILLVHILISMLWTIKLVRKKNINLFDIKYISIFIFFSAISFFIWTNFLIKNSTVSSMITYFEYNLLNSNISHWRWWFVNNYPAANVATIPLGWPGIMGAVKYYGYYLSPLLLFTIIFLVTASFKVRALRKDILIGISLPFLITFLFFAEILPRINNPLIPERFWILIDIFLLIIIVPLLKQTELSKYRARLFSIWMILIFIGLCGSIYLAKGKNQTIISYNDLKAKNWIINNSSSDSVFLTQSSNDALFAYFFKKNFATNVPENELENMDLIKNNYPQKKLLIYYSKNRFENIYAQREWWQMKNYYNIDINRLNEIYNLAYQKDGVYIWKVN